MWLAKAARCCFVSPPAGLFGWVDVGSDTEALAQVLLDEGWLIAPGTLFHATPRPTSLMRMNFATMQDARFWQRLQKLRGGHGHGEACGRTDLQAGGLREWRTGAAAARPNCGALGLHQQGRAKPSLKRGSASVRASDRRAQPTGRRPRCLHPARLSESRAGSVRTAPSVPLWPRAALETKPEALQ